MKYEVSCVLDCTIEVACRLYINHELMPLWEEGLQRIEWIHETPSLVGNIGYLVFLGPEGEFKMKYKIESIEHPHTVIMIYEMGMVWNRCVNHFASMGEWTSWTMEVEFSGIESWNLPKESFIKKTTAGMQLFVDFVKKYEQR
jgi:hypothetical protein